MFQAVPEVLLQKRAVGWQFIELKAERQSPELDGAHNHQRNKSRYDSRLQSSVADVGAKLSSEMLEMRRHGKFVAQRSFAAKFEKQAAELCTVGLLPFEIQH